MQSEGGAAMDNGRGLHEGGPPPEMFYMKRPCLGYDQRDGQYELGGCHHWGLNQRCISQLAGCQDQKARGTRGHNQVGLVWVKGSREPRRRKPRWY
ncbi:hypothetical protein GOP47_0008153 [Adiantum capillus-veneris]|uniref:Uncharacterized protein n=1 Tax=Adiantum capillus-veneris TaxID=13818 RepID=A0A9D4ZHS7_ADICA|nr:hypothetical protein GOP47_0008153 [Adiantum capillus-veneris]